MLTGIFDVTRDNQNTIVAKVRTALQSQTECQVLYQEVSTIPDHQLARGPENKLTRTYAIVLYLALATLGIYKQLPPKPGNYSIAEYHRHCVDHFEQFYYGRFFPEGKRVNRPARLEFSDLEIEKSEEIIRNTLNSEYVTSESSDSSTEMAANPFDKATYQSLLDKDLLGVDALKKVLKDELGQTVQTGAQKADLRNQLQTFIDNMPATGGAAGGGAGGGGSSGTPITLTAEALQDIMTKSIAAATQAIQSAGGGTAAEAKTAGTIQDVFNELNEHLPQQVSCGRFGKLACYLPAAASRNGKKSKITEIKSFELMFCAIARQIQSVASQRPFSAIDLHIFTAMLELVSFSRLNNRDTIEIVRMAWYDTLTNVSDFDFQGKTAAVIRAQVRQAYNNSIEETRAVEAAAGEDTRVRSLSLGQQPLPVSNNGNGSTGGTHKKKSSNKPCSFFNSESGCKMTESTCKRRHVCAWHFKHRNESYSDHSAANCKARKAEEGSDQ